MNHFARPNLSGKTVRTRGCLLTVLLASAPTWQVTQAQTTDPDARRTQTRQAAIATTRAWAKDPAAKVIGPFVKVDHGTVTILGEATGLAGADPVEFFLISPTSGKGYESLAVSYATATDIDAALRSLGLVPGHPVDPEHVRFFARGPRLELTFHWATPAGEQSATTGQLIGRPPAAEGGKPTTRPTRPGLVYVGSQPARVDAGAAPKLSADLGDVGSIASTYNEPSTLLDVPRFAPQGAVYHQQLPAASLQKGQPLTITLTPLKDVHQMDQRLLLLMPPDSQPPAVAVQIFAPEDPNPGMMSAHNVRQTTLEDAIKQILATPPTDELFLHPSISPEVPLGEVARFYRALSATSTLDKCQIEAPKPDTDQLYFQSFLPDETNRDPAQRLFPSAELDLTSAKPTFRRLDDPPAADAATTQPTWKITAQSVATPEALTAALAGPLKPADPDDRRPLFVFAPATLTHAQLWQWLKPIRSQYPVIWVYLPK